EAELAAADRLREIEAELVRIEHSFAPMRPTGPVGRGNLSAEQYRYFALREQADAVRELLRKQQERFGDDRLSRASALAYPTAERTRTPQKLYKLLRSYGVRGEGFILRQAASALNLDEFLRELTSHVTADPGDSGLTELERQRGLLRAMAAMPQHDD